VFVTQLDAFLPRQFDRKILVPGIRIDQVALAVSFRNHITLFHRHLCRSLSDIAGSYSTGSKSPGFQLLSNHGSRGPYSRSSTLNPFPGMVWIQLPSCPLGASGPNQMV